MRVVALLWTAALVLTADAWGFRDGVFHNSIWLEQAAGVYHRESRSGRYQLTYREAKAVCKYEGGRLATLQQLEAARQIGFHICAAGWLDRGRVGYPIVKAGANCGFGRVGVIDYGYRLNKSERWDVYCYNPTGEHARTHAGATATLHPDPPQSDPEEPWRWNTFSARQMQWLYSIIGIINRKHKHKPNTRCRYRPVDLPPGTSGGERFRRHCPQCQHVCLIRSPQHKDFLCATGFRAHTQQSHRPNMSRACSWLNARSRAAGGPEQQGVQSSRGSLGGKGSHACEGGGAEAVCVSAKECGGVLTEQQKTIQSPGFPDQYQDHQICYWHIRVRLGQRIRLHFLEFDVEDDTACLADFLDVYDSYDDVSGFAGRFCGDYLPDDIISTGNVMTLKFLSDASVTAGGFQLQYTALNASKDSVH